MDEFIYKIISPRNQSKSHDKDTFDESFHSLGSEPILPFESCTYTEKELDCSSSKKGRLPGTKTLKTPEEYNTKIDKLEKTMKEYLNNGGDTYDKEYVNLRQRCAYAKRKKNRLSESNSVQKRRLVFQSRNYLEEIKVYNIPIIMWMKEAIKDGMPNFKTIPQTIHLLGESDVATIENRFNSMEIFGHQTQVVITSGNMGSDHRNRSWNIYPGGKLTEIVRGLRGPLVEQICEEGSPTYDNNVKSRFTFKSGPDLVVQNYRFNIDNLDLEVVVKNKFNVNQHTKMINTHLFVMIMHNENEKGEKMESRVIRIGCWFKSNVDNENYFITIQIFTNTIKNYPKSISSIMKRNQLETYAFQLQQFQGLSVEEQITRLNTVRNWICK